MADPDEGRSPPPVAKVASDSLPVGTDEGATPVVVGPGRYGSSSSPPTVPPIPHNVLSNAGPATDSSPTPSQPVGSGSKIVTPGTGKADLGSGSYETKGPDLAGKLTPDEQEFASLRPFETMLGDPLGEVARKERRSLLGVSALATFVGFADLIPTKIENFGIAFTPPKRQALLWMFVAVVMYYLVTFIIYAVGDYLLHRRKVHVARVELKKRETGIGAVANEGVTLVEPEWHPGRYVDRTSRSRTFVDCIAPLIVAALGIASLVYAALFVEPAVPNPATAPAITPAVPPGTAPSPKTIPHR
jgi:hypothetical protein